MFIKEVRKEKIPNGYKMILFGVKSLLPKYHEIILKKVYKEKKIETVIPLYKTCAFHF